MEVLPLPATTLPELASEPWTFACTRAMRALMTGDLDAAETLADRALLLGYANDHAGEVHWVQIASVRREQGRFAELEDDLRAFAAEHPETVTWRCALALLLADSNRRKEARAELDALGADGFHGFQLADLALAGEAAARARHLPAASVIYSALIAFSGRNVFAGGIAACWGSTSRVLALLADALDRPHWAARHFRAAIDENRESGMVTWTARCQAEYAALLRDCDPDGAARLAGEARATAEQHDLKAVGGLADMVLSALAFAA